MARFVVLARDFDFAEMSRRATLDQSPTHVLGDLSARLDATVISPGNVARPPRPWRCALRLAGRVFAQTDTWYVAYDVARRARTGDLVYITGEDVGLASLVLCAIRRRRPSFALDLVWPERRVSTRLVLAFKRRIALVLVATPEHREQVRSMAGQNCPRIEVLPLAMDLRFFSPPVEEPARSRPLLVSAGLVARDYASLATAIDGLDVDAEVCAVSSRAPDTNRPAMPERAVDNLVFGDHSLVELRDLYRRATLVVVPLLEGNLGAGATVVREAMSVGVPVIVTAPEGSIADYVRQGLVVGVPARRPDLLRAAISTLLDDPARRRAMSVRGRAFMESEGSTDRYVETMTERLVAAQSIPG
jgi:glycosyltransferase involved in cell wall biosynthesis